MKKFISLALALVLVLVCFVGCKQDDGPTDLVKVKVAHHMGLSGAGVCAIATHTDIFKNEGIEVELVPFTSGPTEVAAMVSGELQFGYIGNGATPLAINGDVEVICFQNIGDAEVIMVRKDSGIKTVADLKGKTLATQLGTSGETVVNLAVNRAGLTVGENSDQVNVINMDMGGCVTAMVSGKVDAVCVWGNYYQAIKAELGDNLLELARTSDFADESTSIASWLTTQEYMDANPEVVQSFVNAIIKSYDYWKDHKEEVAGWVSEIVDTDKETIMQQYETFAFYGSEEFEQHLNDGSMRTWYEVQQKSFLTTGKIDKAVDLEEYIHFDLMQNACKNAK